jgi:hypothetical protein
MFSRDGFGGHSLLLISTVRLFRELPIARFVENVDALKEDRVRYLFLPIEHALQGRLAYSKAIR